MSTVERAAQVPTTNGGRPRAGRAQLAAAAPGLLVVAGGVALAALEGGYPPSVWYPAALFLLVLLTLLLVLGGPPLRGLPRGLRLGLLALALFCAWSYLTMLWADAPGDAWLGANRTLLYGLVVGVVALTPWARLSTLVAVGLVGLGCAALALAVLIVAVSSSEVRTIFLEGRLADPTGYLNATANLWLIGFWPALYLATARPLPWPLRGLSLGAAVLLLQMAVLSQSRGSAIAFAVTAVLYLLLTPRRWPALLALACAFGLTAIAFDTLTAVRESSAAGLGPALDEAAGAIALCCAAAAAAGTAAALAGARLRPVLDRRPALHRAGDALLVAGVVAAAVAALVAIGDPAGWADARWRDFKQSGYSEVESSRTRFAGSLGSSRYDFYRVALDQFAERPLTGAGPDNYAAYYLEHRRTGEAPRHPHSLAMRLLSQTGIVGTALFLAFLGLFLAAAWGTRRRAAPDDGCLAVAALAAFAVWLVHSLGDWLWAFPALGTLALALLAVAARFRPGATALPAVGRHLDAHPAARPPAASAPAQRRALRAGLALAVIAGALSLALPGIAARYTRAAYDDFGADAERALARLDRAADLNPLSAEPLVAEGILARRLGRRPRALEALDEAVRREPRNWFAQLELGLALAADGRRAAALRHLRAAERLNPRQPLVDELVVSVRRGGRPDAAAVERRLTSDLRDRLRPTDPGAAGGG